MSSGNDIQPQSLEEQIEAFIPYASHDERKTKYLSYRASGFSPKEACRLVDVELRTLYRWREDPEFKDIETGQLAEIRKSLGSQFTLMEFLRNTRLVLSKDFDIIMRAMGRVTIDGDDTDRMDTLSEREWQYFKDAVKRYGPDQLMKLQAAVQGKSTSDTVHQEFNFTRFAIELHQEKEQQVIEVRPVEQLE